MSKMLKTHLRSMPKKGEIMSRTGIVGVSDALFAEQEKLQALDMSDAGAAQAEIARAKAVKEIAGTIIENHRFVLDVAKTKADIDGGELKVPKGLLS